MPPSLLVVDDSTTARKMLMLALPKEWAGGVTQAANGEEALTAYRARRPDLVFLDLNMPVMDGYEVLEQLKDDPNRPPIVVLTGDIQPKAESRVRALGAVAFLKKPVARDALAAILREQGLV